MSPGQRLRYHIEKMIDPLKTSKKNITKYKYIPIACMTVAVFGMTFQSSSTSLLISNLLRNLLISSYELLGINPDMAWWNTPRTIRSLGHIIEYFIVALISGVTFESKVVAISFCISISLIDQFVKIIAPNRYFDINDIPYDIVGFGIGLLLIWSLSYLLRLLKRE